MTRWRRKAEEVTVERINPHFSMAGYSWKVGNAEDDYVFLTDEDFKAQFEEVPGETSSEPTREELIAALTCAESILWMAEEQAVYVRHVEPKVLAQFNDASETIRAVLGRCREVNGEAEQL